MAVSTTNAVSGPYTTNGATTVFPFTFTAPSTAEVEVMLRDADGVEMSATGFVVSLGVGGGGSVTFDTAPAAGYDLFVLLAPSFTQDIEFENGSAWLADPVNEGYDRSAARDQVLKRDIDRAIKLPIGEAGADVTAVPAARAGGVLGFNFNGDVEVVYTTAGTLENNSGFTAGGASKIKGNSATLFQIVRADNTAMLTVDTTTPRVSIAGTRTSDAPRITAGSGTDSNFDSFLTSNCVANGTTLFRDEFQDRSTFESLNGAHASFDAFCEFTGSSAMNHSRGFQARGKVSMTGGALLAEWTGVDIMPIFNGTFNIDQTFGVRIEDAEVDSGAQNLFNAYAIYIDDLPNWGPNVYGIYNASERCYFGGNIQCSPTGTDIYDALRVEAKSVHATNTVASFKATGGGVMYWDGTYAHLKGYTNGAGAAAPIRLNDTGGDVQSGGHIKLDSGKAFYVNNIKVVGAQGAAVTDAVAAAAAPTQAEFNALVTQFNALLARVRAHGLIA